MSAAEQSSVFQSLSVATIAAARPCWSRKNTGASPMHFSTSWRSTPASASLRRSSSRRGGEGANPDSSSKVKERGLISHSPRWVRPHKFGGPSGKGFKSTSHLRQGQEQRPGRAGRGDH